VIARGWLACCLLAAAPLAGQSAAGRWSVQLRSERLLDRAELRIGADSSRMVLESRDAAWLPLAALELQDGAIRFEVPGIARWTGRVSGDVMQGEAILADGSRATWEAHRIQPGTARWPVRPRIVARQLVVGSSDTLAQFPDALLGRMLTRDALVSEHARLALAAGFPAADLAGIIARAERTMLGFDRVARLRVSEILETIARSPAADATFRGLFVQREGGWRLDLHDFAWQHAAARLGRASLDTGLVAAALAAVGLAVEDDADGAVVRRTAWLAWGRLRAAAPASAPLELPPGMPGGPELRALLDGYDESVGWWTAAVRWLMESRWIAGQDGWRSPADLVAAFWERGTLDLPRIEPHHFGTYQAVPMIGSARVAARLLLADNAIARDWLADDANRREALEAWRRVEPGGTLRMTHGDSTLLVASAAWIARSRLGGFLAAEDGVRIEPAILPVLAVGTMVHEWQHLLFEAARLGDSASGALQETAWGLSLVESDPWLAEGAAEWATEAILSAPGVPPLLAFLESEKRLAIGSWIPEDTHVLGYLLVRTGINRTDDARALRRTLERHLHDPAAFARAIGLAGDAHQRGVPRPATLVVIPEVRFTLDAGLADSPTRLLRVPSSTEH
jgi:hypothetical protein